MGAIDIGHGAADGTNVCYGSRTYVDLTNPANDTGTLTSFELWCASDGAAVKVGTFSGSGGTFTNRDYETIGAVTSGSKQTFTGKSCSVSSGDYIGIYDTTDSVERHGLSGSGIYHKIVDAFGAGAQTGYSYIEEYWIGAYGAGSTATGWTTAKLGGIASASIIKVAGISVASVKKVAGVAVQ